MIGSKLFFLIFIVINLCAIQALISDQRLCGDPNCSEPVSLAKTVIKYISADYGILSFLPNVDIKVYSKSAGTRKDLWGVEINGKRGYIPLMHVRETKILVKTLNHVVPTELLKETTKSLPAESELKKPSEIVDKPNVSPDSVAEPFTIIDGTTIPIALGSSSEYYSTESITENPIQQSKSNIAESVIEPTLSVTPDPKAVYNNVWQNFGQTQETDNQEQSSEQTQIDEENYESEENKENSSEEVFVEEPNLSQLSIEDEQNVETVQTKNLELNVSNTEKNDVLNVLVETNVHQQDVDQKVKPIEAQQDENPYKSDTVQNVETNVEKSEQILNATSAEINEEVGISLEKSIEMTQDENTQALETVKNDDITDSQLHEQNVSFNLPNSIDEVAKEIQNVKVPDSLSPVSDSIYTQNAEVIHELPMTIENPLVTESSEQLSVSHTDAEDTSSVSTDNIKISPTVHYETDTNHANNPSTSLYKQFTETTTPNHFNTEPAINSQDTSKPEIEATEKVPVEKQEIESENEELGFFMKMYYSVFGSDETASEINDPIIIKEENIKDTSNMNPWDILKSHSHEKPVEKYLDPQSSNQQKQNDQSCKPNESECMTDPKDAEESTIELTSDMDLSALEFPGNIYTLFVCLSVTAFTILVFCLGHYYIEKHRQDGSLVASINSLEKKLLVISKENLMLQDEVKTTKDRLSSINNSSLDSDELVTGLKQDLEDSQAIRLELEEQIVGLEKELENATEAGMELNRMLQEFLSSQNGDENVMEKIEYLQKQLMEQQITINRNNTMLNAKNTENQLLQTELTVVNEKVTQFQVELDKMVVHLLSIQEEKKNTENELEMQNMKIKQDYEIAIKAEREELQATKEDNTKLRNIIDETKRSLKLKSSEYILLEESMNELQSVQSNKESLAALLDVSKVKAEVQQLREEKHSLVQKLHVEQENNLIFEKQVEVVMQEMKILKDKNEEAERDKVEAQTRLEVLSSYFKEKETQLQKEINEQESLWVQKQGEATSTIERIKWIQEELQNYKSQNEVLKKEILDQEVSLKSQISMLEKKSHDSWVLARQAERRLEETKQEASQLRNRLTIVEKNLNNSVQTEDGKNRIMSPLEANGTISASPLHMSNIETSGSPPLLFPHRDHMTTSPPLPGMPPFMPPPPGVPFLPPPLTGGPPFLPPPPAIFPGDHRPPPLGRMSSPPLHSRYSNDSRAYSPYDRDDSPTLYPYPDEYGRHTPPPMHRPYSPYNDRDYRGPPHRNKPRNHKDATLSSGSGHSNESLDNSGRQSGRV